MTTALANIVTQLRAEKRPNRKLDVQIGEAAGYREVTEPGHPPYSWHYPDG